jgi:Ion channel.
MPTRSRWEVVTEWPLNIAAVVFLIAYAIPVAQPDAAGWLLLACEVVIWVTWGLFAVDYVTRFALAKGKWRFLRSNLIDLAAVVLPMLRPLRLVRLLSLLSILNRTATQRLHGRVVTYTVGAVSLLVIVGALAVTDAERGVPGANIENLGDGFWWAAVTIATVGYGDRFPVSPIGRGVAVALMVGGIALLGVVTATIASWLVQRVADVTVQQETATREQVELLASELAEIKGHLATLLLSTANPGLLPAAEEAATTERAEDLSSPHQVMGADLG